MKPMILFVALPFAIGLASLVVAFIWARTNEENDNPDNNRTFLDQFVLGLDDFGKRLIFVLVFILVLALFFLFFNNVTFSGFF